LQNYEIGRGHEAQNRMSEANVYYNEAIRIAQDEIARNVANANTYTVMTWAMRRQNRHADVLLWGARGLELHANAHSLVETMGQSLFFLGDHTRALNYMRRYVNSVPIGGRAPVAYFFKGEIYRLRGQFHSADIAYTTAVSLHPNLALWWFRLGSVREAIGDYPYAIAAFQQAVNLSPNLAGASAALARSQLQLSGQ
jgi:tetratricopeptide (TPR) repeat protein